MGDMELMIPDLPRLAWAKEFESLKPPSVARNLLLATFCYCFWDTECFFRV